MQVKGQTATDRCGACFCCCPDRELRVADDVVYVTGLAVRFSQLIQSQEISVSLAG